MKSQKGLKDRDIGPDFDVLLLADNGVRIKGGPEPSEKIIQNDLVTIGRFLFKFILADHTILPGAFRIWIKCVQKCRKIAGC